MTDVYSPRMKRSWFNLSFDEAKESADLYIYDDIGMWGVTANDFKEQLLAINAKSMNVYINSNGGEVDAGLAIFNLLKRHTAQKTIHIDGIAASMASVIAMAGDKIVMPDTALMFIHKPWTIAMGNADDFQKTAEQLNTWEAALVAAYASKTGASSETIAEMLRDEKLLSADEAIALGFADEKTTATEPAFAFRGAMTAKVLGHLAKRTSIVAETVIEPEPESVVVADEPVATDTAPVEPVAAPTAPVAPVDSRAEFNQFVARFGSVRASAYFASGLTFDQAERKYTDELIAENEELRKRPVVGATDSIVRPVAVIVDDPVTAKMTYDEAQAAYAKITDPKAKLEFRQKHSAELKLS